MLIAEKKWQPFCSVFHLYYVDVKMNIRVIQQSFSRPGTQAVSCGKMEQDNDMYEEKTQQYGLLADLVRRSQDGDTGAMEALYEQFKTPLFNLAYRYTYNHAVAEDLLQDIFIKIFSNIHSLDAEKAFVGWIYRVAVNSCLTYLRRNKSPVQKAVSLDEVWNVKENYEDDDIRESALNRSLDSAIQNLPGKLKSVFLLHDYQGFKHDEIAEIMGWSVGTSKSQLFKARMKIRNNLKSRDRLQEKSHEVQ